jgi:2-oxoisovalerate ferredoxin oxidoreductase alpha subunit
MTSSGPRTLLKGNEAAVYGALLGGCECFFGYPITPASEIAHASASLFPKLGRAFLQAESEIAAINMCLGSASAGRRSLTASSGLGISLKQEGVSYIAACELPCVIIDITRGGPGLGNIGPEQSDYNQLVKGGGHGNYKTIVLAPNSVQEMCDLTMKAFDLADKYRTPVYVVADGVIGQMIESITLPRAVEGRPVRPDYAILAEHGSQANVITSIYLDYDDLEAVNQRLQDKYAEIQANEQDAECVDLDEADIVLVGYGVSSRIIRTAMAPLQKAGIKVGLLRPRTLWPTPIDALKTAAKHAKAFVVVEMSNGQFADDVRLAIECSRPVKLCNRMGGNVPTTKQIVEFVTELHATL